MTTSTSEGWMSGWSSKMPSSRSCRTSISRVGEWQTWTWIESSGVPVRVRVVRVGAHTKDVALQSGQAGGGARRVFGGWKVHHRGGVQLFLQQHLQVAGRSAPGAEQIVVLLVVAALVAAWAACPRTGARG